MVKVINKVSKSNNSDLTFWLSQKPEERLSCVEKLRRQYSGNLARLQRSIKSFQRPRG
jgi:hypothetical protein